MPVHMVTAVHECAAVWERYDPEGACYSAVVTGDNRFAIHDHIPLLTGAPIMCFPTICGISVGLLALRCINVGYAERLCGKCHTMKSDLYVTDVCAGNLPPVWMGSNLHVTGTRCPRLRASDGCPPGTR